MPRIRILLGHTGSGKTEIAINLAIKEALLGKKVVIIDLDIVNPYFCVRDIQNELEDKYGINIISSNSCLSNAELMVLPSKVINYLVNDNYTVILDIGGGVEGAKVLAQYIKYLDGNSYEASFIVNVFRAETMELSDILCYLQEIEKVSGIKVSQIINNSNLLNETTTEEIHTAEEQINELANRLLLPVKYTVINNEVENINICNLKNQVLLINLFFKPF